MKTRADWIFGRGNRGRKEGLQLTHGFSWECCCATIATVTTITITPTGIPTCPRGTWCGSGKGGIVDLAGSGRKYRGEFRQWLKIATRGWAGSK